MFSRGEMQNLPAATFGVIAPTAAALGACPDLPIKAHPKPLARIEIMVRDAGDTPTLAMWEFVPGE